MKALTICQPYAEMIALHEKRIENRTWPTSYRGTLLIHAGKSRDWLEADDEREYSDMAFGAVVAIADLFDCRRLADLPDAWSRHVHANGPWCWMLNDVRRVMTPIPWRGAQGLWDVPAELAAAVRDPEGQAAVPDQEGEGRP